MGKPKRVNSPERVAFVEAARIWRLVEAAGNRSMASDGPCGPEHENLDAREYHDMLKHAKAIVAALEPKP